MPRVYRVPFSIAATAANGDIDLLNLAPAADKPCRLKGWILGQTTEVGDAQEEMLDLAVREFAATVTDGSGGSAVTGAPVDPNDSAAGFTARCGDTTVATTSGTNTLHERIPWNVRSAPWERYVPDEDRIRVGGTGRRIIVRLETAVTDDTTIKGFFLVEEL